MLAHGALGLVSTEMSAVTGFNGIHLIRLAAFTQEEHAVDRTLFAVARLFAFGFKMEKGDLSQNSNVQVEISVKSRNVPWPNLL